MNKINTVKKENKISFENIKHIDSNGNEFWYARELQEVLGYIQWRNFKIVIDKAKETCDNSNVIVSDNFADISKIGKK